MDAAEEACSNLYILHSDSIEVDGISFTGTPLWYQGPVLYADEKIAGFNTFEWIQTREQLGIEALERGKGIAITHHMPHPASIHRKYQDADNHAFYNPRAKHIVESGQYKLWIHGHTHESCDYVVPGKLTRVLCNPYGYHDYETNPKWNPYLTIDV